MNLRNRTARIRSQIERAAVEQVEAAEAEYERLQRAVADGDETVTAADLAEAKATIELAELKVQNARRVAEEEAAAERERAVGEFADRVGPAASAADDLSAEVTEARSAATTALHSLYGAAERQRAAIVALAQEGAALGLDEVTGHGVRVRTAPDHVAVRVGHSQVDAVDPVDRVAQVVAEVLGEAPHPFQIEANRLAGRATRADAGGVVPISMLSAAQRLKRQQDRHRASIEASQRAQREAEQRAAETARGRGDRGTF